MVPTAIAAKEAKRTAAAAKSFVFLMAKCLSGDTKSAKNSIAVFIISSEKTSPMDKLI